MVKSFIIFYYQCHKNAFHEEVFLSVYSILHMELYFLGLVENHSQFLALGCLESVSGKKKLCTLKKKPLAKKFKVVR